MDYFLQESFKGVKSWIRELKEKGPKNIIVAIAGNKLDLEDEREVSTEGNYLSEVLPILGWLFGVALGPPALAVLLALFTFVSFLFNVYLH